MAVEKRYPATILATACIPWDERLEFEEALFRKEVRHLVRKGVSHIYLFGSAGEGYAVSEEQFDTIVAAFADEMAAPGLSPMVGVIGTSAEQMKRRIQRAYARGIRAFQFSLPAWGSLTPAETSVHFHGLCDAFPDCRFMHYNTGRAGRPLGVQEYDKLAAEIPNLVAVKFLGREMPAAHEIAASSCPLRFFLGELSFGYAQMAGGDCGYLISMANSNIETAWKYFEAGVKRDYGTVMGFHTEFACVLRFLMETLGPNLMDGAYDKMYVRLVLPDFPLRLLPPYAQPSEGAFAAYKTFLETTFPHWLEPRGRRA